MATSFKANTKYNQLKHSVEIYLDNSNSESELRRFPINPNAIINLTIESDLADWVTRGTMTFLYTPNAVLDGKDSKTGNNINAIPSIARKIADPRVFLNKQTNQLVKDSIKTPEQNGSYVFRCDGNDLLKIRITPAPDDPSNFSKTGTSKYAGYDVDQSDKFWSLTHLFSISDIEDIENMPGATGAASADLKCLKVYFHDIRFQKMSANLIEYSTALSELAPKTSFKDEDNSIPTGMILKEIIEKSTQDLNLNIKQIVGEKDKEEWEEGGTKLFYTAPAYVSAYDALNYVYNHHTSTEKYTSTSFGTDINIHDLSILTIEKGPAPDDVGYFTLKPLSWYFKKAGNTANEPGILQTEHFYLQGYADSKINVSKKKRAPTSNNTSKVDIKSPKHNIISSYNFVDISPKTNSNTFRSRPVHSFNFSSRQFNIEFQNNTVTKAREFIAKQYISNVYKNDGADPEKLFLITLDKDKRNLSLTPTFSLYGEDPITRQCVGIQKLIYTGVFQNACIHFRAPGLPFRQIGRFIAIDRTEGVESSIYNDKLYGQWFIISIRHVFEGEMYYNDITAVKLHRFDKLSLEFTGTIDN